MADERDETSGNATDVAGAEQRTAGISRRAMLRGASAVVPTILTLKSGTALAIASNQVTATANPRPSNGQYVALNTTGQNGPAYNYRSGEALLIPDALYVDDRNLGTKDRTDLYAGSEVKDLQVLTADKLCTTQKVLYHRVAITKQSGNNTFYKLSKSDSVPQCAYLSATAWTSVNTSKQVFAKPLF